MRGHTESSDSDSEIMTEFSVGANEDNNIQEFFSGDEETTTRKDSGIETIAESSVSGTPVGVQLETERTHVLSHEEISDMLLKAASLSEGLKRYPIFRNCNSQTFTSISKALVVYSSNTKPSEAAHLFDPRVLVRKARTRTERKSWLFLLNLTDSKILRLDEGKRLDLAKKMATVMKTGLKHDDKVLYYCKVAWIVGFWLSRLYEEHHNVQVSKLPKELRKTRKFFLTHFGKQFMDMRIMLPESDSSGESKPLQPEPDPEKIEMMSHVPVPDHIQQSSSNRRQDVEFLAGIIRSAGLELVALFPSKEVQLHFGLDTLQTRGENSGPSSKRPKLELGKKEGLDQGEGLSMLNRAIGKYLLKLHRTQAVLEVSRKINGFGISLMEAERDRVREIQGRGESMVIGRDVQGETLEFLRQVRNWARDFHGDMQKVMDVADGKDVGGGSTCTQI